MTQETIAALIESGMGNQGFAHVPSDAFPSPEYDNAPTWRQDGALSW